MAANIAELMGQQPVYRPGVYLGQMVPFSVNPSTDTVSSVSFLPPGTRWHSKDIINDAITQSNIAFRIPFTKQVADIFFKLYNAGRDTDPNMETGWKWLLDRGEINQTEFNQIGNFLGSSIKDGLYFNYSYKISPGYFVEKIYYPRLIEYIKQRDGLATYKDASTVADLEMGLMSSAYKAKKKKEFEDQLGNMCDNQYTSMPASLKKQYKDVYGIDLDQVCPARKARQDQEAAEAALKAQIEKAGQIANDQTAKQTFCTGAFLSMTEEEKALYKAGGVDYDSMCAVFNKTVDMNSIRPEEKNTNAPTNSKIIWIASGIMVVLLVVGFVVWKLKN